MILFQVSSKILKDGNFLITPPLSESNRLTMSKWNETVNPLTHWGPGDCGLAFEQWFKG
jgi:hypothetical protein